ncbi:uncharacterized protein TNCV_3020821 [Trichonephila clavipes]|nr:uncharacterized protein TNCV_3020821 [Trichonephila clavipes]
MASNSETQINLKTLQRVDSNIVEIIDNASQVAIYKYEGKLERWEGTEVEDFNDDYKEEITDFVQSIPGFQERDEEDEETWMACNVEDCGFQMLNNDEIVTSVHEESNPVDDETDEEDNNSESSKGPSNAGAFSALETTMEWHEQQSECCPTQLLLLKRIRDFATKKRRCTMVQRKKKVIIFHNKVSGFIYCMDRIRSVFGYPNSIWSQLIRINDVRLFYDTLRHELAAAVAEWYRYRTVACFVTGSSPVPLKTRRVGQRCTLNLSRAETSSRWCGVVVRRGGCQLRCRPRHLTMVQNYVVRRQKPSCS